MKIILKRLLILVLFCLSMTAYAASIPDVFFEPQKPIVVNAQQPVITIQLNENPTTGYRWFIKDYPQQWLTLQKHSFIGPQANKPGAPGVASWTFVVNKAALLAPHMLKIEYVYARPWDMQDHPTERAVVILTQP